MPLWICPCLFCNTPATDPGRSPQAAGGVGAHSGREQKARGGGTSSGSSGGRGRAAAATAGGGVGGGIGGCWQWRRGWASHQRCQPLAAAAVCSVRGWHDPGGVMCVSVCVTFCKWEAVQPAAPSETEQFSCRQSNHTQNLPWVRPRREVQGECPLHFSSNVCVTAAPDRSRTAEETQNDLSLWRAQRQQHAIQRVLASTRYNTLI